MEYLRTPDVSNHPAWGHASPTVKPSPDPKQQTNQFSTGSTNNLSLPASTLSLSNAAPISTQQIPDATPGAQFTPRFSGTTPFFSNIAQHASLDRAGIKNSFQTLFSPSPHITTPALLRSSQPPTGLTPFINGITTPNLMPPPGTISPSPAPKHTVSPSPGANPNDALLSSPYLQAAAKEAVRREFMNMPTYVTASPSERTVPAMRYLSPSPQLQSSPINPSSALPVVPSSIPQNVPVSLAGPPSTTPPRFVSPNSGDAKVPGTDMNSSKGHSNNEDSNGKPTNTTTTHTTASSGDIGVEAKQESVSSLPMVSQHLPTVSQQQAQSMPQMSAPQHQMAPFFVPPGHPAPGMMMIGQHGPMMIGPPPGAMYAPPPGMMMFPGGQMFPQPGMMMPTGGHVPTDVPTKPESSEDRKARIEHEKQELIREFKKKTREAALVRFRQKRRERRFDKLIRYDCRKKLADARPRVKGRFVRVKNGEGDDDEMSEGAQIVPDMED